MPDVRALSEPEVARFDHVPAEDARRARVVPVAVLPPGSAAMALGRYVLVRRDRAGDEVLLAHELVHVRLWRQLGVVRFLARYLAAYLRGLARTRSHRRAYLDIPAEAEARAETAAWAARRLP
jgi:hypothetical protein